jgi:hypothetical protein
LGQEPVSDADQQLIPTLKHKYEASNQPHSEKPDDDEIIILSLS